MPHYKIFLVGGDEQKPLTVDADDVDLEYSNETDDSWGNPSAFNFTKGEDEISVAWIPFEMVKAIIS